MTVLPLATFVYDGGELDVRVEIGQAVRPVRVDQAATVDNQVELHGEAGNVTEVVEDLGELVVEFRVLDRLCRGPSGQRHRAHHGQPGREPKRSCKPHVPPSEQWGSVHPPETVWPSASGPRTVTASSNRWRSIAQIAQPRLTSALAPSRRIRTSVRHWRVARPVLNVEQPPHIPQRPMGSIPVVIRLVRPDGEEWWPGTANRWTDTHVLVHWVEDDDQAQAHRYELAWLRAEDVRRFLKT